jgi:integrase
LGLREARGNEELLGPPGRGTGETEPREEAAKVLEACPDVEWQLIFALARYGGLRTPSETLALKWSDVNWEARMFTVRSPKTEHPEDGGIRVVPIFKELRPYLDAVSPTVAPRTR